jgi:hypothetical protein
MEKCSSVLPWQLVVYDFSEFRVTCPINKVAFLDVIRRRAKLANSLILEGDKVGHLIIITENEALVIMEIDAFDSLCLDEFSLHAECDATI